MPIDAVVIIVTGAAFGGLVNGLAGFGAGLFTLGLWLQVLPLTSAVALVVILSFVSGVQGTFAVRQALNWPRLRRFLILAFAGLPFGLIMLDDRDVGMLKLLVGSLLALFGGVFMLRPRFARWQRDHKLADIAVRFVGGALGALAGLSRALPASVIGAQLGIVIFWRLTGSQFRKVLLWLILSSGIVLVGRELTAWLAATG